MEAKLTVYPSFVFPLNFEHSAPFQCECNISQPCLKLHMHCILQVIHMEIVFQKKNENTRYNLTLMHSEIRLYHIFNDSWLTECRIRNYIAFCSQSCLKIA